MGTDHYSVTWKYINIRGVISKQFLNKMKSLSDIKQLLKEIKDEPMHYRD